MTVQFWLGLPSQVATVMGVSLTAESPVSATHLPARYPDTIGPETGRAALITDTVPSPMLVTQAVSVARFTATPTGRCRRG